MRRPRYNEFRNWKTEEVTKLRNLFIKGTPIKDIAIKLNRNNDAIVFRLIKIGILGYPHEEGFANHGQIWSESEKNLLLNEYKEGKSINEIAKKHRRNKNAILFKLIESEAFDYTSRAELEKHLHQDVTNLVGIVDIDSNQNIGGKSKMGFERMPLNTTKMIEPKGNNLLTGRPDAIYLRNKYQKEVDNAYAESVNMVHYVEEESKKLRESFNSAQGLKQDIKAHESERADLYDSLGNLLNKETDFEDKMWGTTQKNSKIKSIKIKQNIKDSNVDEMRFDSMQDYIKQYPEYQSKSSFKKLLDDISKKEREIREAKKLYNDAVSRYNYYLSFFEKHIQKSEDKLSGYHEILKEGKDKLANCRYRKGKFYQIASEETKAEVNMDTITHKVTKIRNTLKILKSEFTQNKRKNFVEMEY